MSFSSFINSLLSPESAGTSIQPAIPRTTSPIVAPAPPLPEVSYIPSTSVAPVKAGVKTAPVSDLQRLAGNPELAKVDIDPLKTPEKFPFTSEGPAPVASPALTTNVSKDANVTKGKTYQVSFLKPDSEKELMPLVGKKLSLFGHGFEVTKAGKGSKDLHPYIQIRVY